LATRIYLNQFFSKIINYPPKRKENTCAVHKCNPRRTPESTWVHKIVFGAQLLIEKCTTTCSHYSQRQAAHRGQRCTVRTRCGHGLRRDSVFFFPIRCQAKFLTSRHVRMHVVIL